MSKSSPGDRSTARTNVSCIVFVEQRYVAMALCEMIKRARELSPASFAGLHVDYLVGFSANMKRAVDAEQVRSRVTVASTTGSADAAASRSSATRVP